MNALLKAFDTPFESVPFSEIELDDYRPAFEQGIAMARAEIDAIVEDPATPDFENTIAALERSGAALQRCAAIFFNLHAAATNPQMEALAQELSPLLTAFNSDVSLNDALFERIETVYDRREALALDEVQGELLRQTYLSFSRNGARLEAAAKETLRGIDCELASCTLTFGDHVLAETNAFTLDVQDEADLEGLPEDVRVRARALAAKKGRDGWRFNLQAPSYVPFMTYAKNRALREALYRAFSTRAARGGEADNRALVLKIAKLRERRARLLGYATHADFVLERCMAENPKTVDDFLRGLLERAYETAKREVVGLQELAAADGIDELQRWDIHYYAEKCKRETLALDEEELRQYFSLEAVIEGAFEIVRALYGLEFAAAQGVQTYHEDVRVYQVSDADGRFLALLYLDLFPRAGKRPGAWMTCFREQAIQDGKDRRPQVSIVCNFSRPTADRPALLRFQEVTTLFHELGHALHSMLSAVPYESLSGTQVYRDFVELPSQLMENWCYEAEALGRFAKHYETRAPMPRAMMEKLKGLRRFLQGCQTVRQLGLGMLDMGWHARDVTEIEDVLAYEEQILEAVQLHPKVAGANTSCSFSHIFEGGYAAGYYAYKWAAVLDADAFALFSREGLFNRAVAERFREHVLSKGGSAHPMLLYKRFRGREPSLEPLLKRAGLDGG